MWFTWKKSLIILVGILMLGGFLRLYKLDNMSLKADEYLGANIVQGYNQTGEWKFWDWNKQELTDKVYTRGQVYYFQVSQLLNFVSPAEFNLRLISVIWGMIGIISMFFLGYFYSKNFVIALLSAFLWAVSISAITFDRHFRMYAMFAPVYLILATLAYQFLESVPGKAENFINKLSARTKLNWNYFIPAFIFLVLSFATHFLTINIFPVIVIYLLVFTIYEWKKDRQALNKYFWLLLLPLISLIILALTGFIGRATEFLGFMENNFGHFNNITTDYSNALLAVTFFTIGAIGLIKQDLKKNTWLLLSFLVPFLSAVFIWDRSSGAQYIYLIQTFQTIIIAAGIYFIAKKVAEVFSIKKWYQFFEKNNSKKFLIMGGVIVYLFSILYNFSYFSNPDSFYQNNKKWNHSNYREVFAYYLKHREDNALLITRNFRNYYYADTNIPVFDFGGEHQAEKELNLAKIKLLEAQNEALWIVINDNDFDYIKGDARAYIRENYELIETTYTGDSMEIWKWVKIN